MIIIFRVHRTPKPRNIVMTLVTNKIPIIKLSNYKVLIDSGSDVNLISENMSKLYKHKIVSENLTFKTANSKLHCKNSITLKIFNQPHKFFIHTFNKDCDLLFGINILKDLKCEINFANEIIKIKNIEFPFIPISESNFHKLNFRSE